MKNLEDILPKREQLDFSMLLQLLPLLNEVKEYKDLPALFSIIGIDKLIVLCKYMGGTTIQIPTLQDLTKEIKALQWYSDVYISHIKTEEEIPYNLRMYVSKIWKCIDNRKMEENQTNA